MANNYYNFPVPFIAGTKVRSEQVNTQYQGVEAGFDLLSTDPDAGIIGTTFLGIDVQGATVNEYLITTPDPRTPLVNGQRVSFFATHSNDGAITLNVDGTGLVAGVNLDGDAVVDGQIISGQFYEWVFDNANTQWLVTKGISGITDPLLLSNGTVGAPTYSFELDPDTGMFQNGANILGFAAGGFLPVQVDASNGAGNLQLILSPGGPQATATFPSLAFGDGDTGLHEPSDDQLAVSLGGVNKFFWAGDVYGSLTGAGPAMLNEAASSTNPTLVPDRGDIDTGLGQNAAGEPSLIGNGAELARGVAALSGGLLVNNLSTGGGLERVLTTGDAGGLVGDVFKVGTPVNNQIGIWTGDGTIEGDTGLTFDGSQLTVSGYTFPAADGSADQFLVTDGAGNLTFRDQVAGGLLSAQFRFSTSTTAADPGSGRFRYNNATPASVTAIFIDDLTTNGVDVSNILSLITTGDRLYIQSETDSSQFAVFNVSAPATDNTGWFTVTVTVEASGTLHDNNDRCLIVLQIGGASAVGDVFKVGTPVNNEIGVWTGDGTLEGDANFTWDGAHLNLPQLDDAVTPTLAFGDGDTGLYENGDDNLRFAHAGVASWAITGSVFLGLAVDAPRLSNSAGSATVPNVIPNRTDANSGLGQGALDELSLIAGGVEGIRLTELNSGVIQAPDANVAVTAFATGGQVSATQLDNGNNVLTTVATIADSVKLPPVFAINSVVFIKNDGAAAADVFPATGDDLGAGVDTAVSLAAGASMSFIATVANSTWTQWIIDLFASGAGDVFKVGTPVNNQLGVWTGDGTIEGDPLLAWSGTILTVGGTIRVANNGGGAILNEQVTLTNPSIITDVGDVDTGFGSGGTNSIAVIVGAQTYSQWRATGAGDGSLEATYDLTTGKTASTIQTQGQAVQNSPEYSEITTVANPNDVITLGSAAVGRKITVVNRGANVLQIFPTSGGDLGQGLNASTTLAVGHSITWLGAGTAGVWAVIGFSDDQTGAGDVIKVGTPVDNEIGVWTGDGTIEGDANFTWDGSHLNLPQLDDAVTPTLAFGDGDTGFYEEVDDTIAVALSGNKEFEFAPVGDPQFADVELLTNLDGTDGQTTFTEQSTNAAVATFVSTAELDTAQFKFGTASLLLDGVSDYIHFPDNVAYALGSGDFVIEGWVRFASLPAVGDEMTFISQWSNTTGTDQSFAISLIQDGLSYRIRGEFEDAVGVFEQGNVGGAPALNTWFHWAAQRRSSDETLSLWWNGNSEFSASGIFSGSMQNSTETLKLGVRDPAGGANAAWVDGWIDDVRITVGSTRYTPGVSLTIPTAAFPTNSGEFTGAAVGAGKLFNTIASLTSPTLVPRNDDDDTGIGGDGTDALAIIAGGVEGMRFTELNDGVISAPAASLAVTAFATGGQGSATQLDNGSNVLATVATTGDSVKLPPVFAANAVVYVKNDGANAADIFPATGDNLGAGLNTAVSIPAGSSMSFIATVANSTWTQWIVDTFGAGDVTKVGTPVNNQVGVWTGDGTLEGDTNFQFNGSQLLLLDGTAAAPSYSWVSDPDTGVYRFSTNRLGFAAGGAAIAVMNSSEFSGVVAGGPAMRLNAAASSTVPVLIPNVTTDSDTGIGWNSADALSLIAGGVEMARFVEAVGIEQTLILNNDNTGLPDLGSLGDPDTGWNWDVANGMYWMGGGSRSWNFTTAQFFSQFSNGAAIINAAAASGQVVFRPDRSDADTGIGTDSADGLQLISGGVVGLTLKEANAGVIQVPQANVAVTAFATGGQVSATQLDESYSVIGTVATTGDSVKLPLTFLINSIMFIKNDGANAADVFPGVGDDLGAGLNTAVSLAAGESASFIATVANSTWTPWIVDTAGTGDVTKVGTPVNNQIGVWTGDGTIEGDVGLTWDGSTLITTGTFQIQTGGGSYRFQSTARPALLNESATSNNPSILPNFSDDDTGIGYGGADVLSLVAGATEIIRIQEGVGNNQTIFGQDNAPALPTVAFGDGDTGFFESLDDQLGLSLGGVQKWFFSGDIFGSLLGGGAAILNETASATNPTIIPDRGDIDTGLGQNAAGQPSLIGNGVELARGVAAASGGLQANNADTGGGLERVLTESDLALPEFQFGPNILLNPNSADWTVNALAPAVADSNNAGLTVRLFDDTVEEGVGFQFEVPAGATNIIFTFRSRAETAPGVVNTVGLDIYNRGIPDNAAVQAWSVSTALTDLSIPTNEFFQEDSQSVTLATLGVTAGELTQFELVRTAPTGGTDLTGDWALGNIKVSFS